MSAPREIFVEKAVVNIGVGEAGERLVKAANVLEMVTGQKPIETISKTTNKDLGIRKGMPIGYKVTLRKGKAEEFVKKAFWVKENKIAGYSFDQNGNFSFGVSDYTDFEGHKYDPDIGVYGMDISVTLARMGKRVVIRSKRKGHLHPKQRVSKEEGIAFVKDKFKVEVIR